MQKTIHAPIKSFGGKGNFLKEIYKYFPPNESYSSYIEPFMGSLVVGLNLPNPKCSCIVNDLNKNIFSFFKVLQDKEMFGRLKEKLDIIFYSEDIFKESYKWLKEAGQEDGYSIEDRAYHFFVVNRFSFSGNLTSFGKNMVIRRGVSKSVSDTFSSIDGLREVHERLQLFIILGRNGIDLIEDYNSSDYFYYCDSPYVWSSRTSARYPVDMDDEEQKKYLTAMVNSKSKFLVSGYDNLLYQDVLEKEYGWQKHCFEIKTVSGTNSPKTKLECVWKNY